MKAGEYRRSELRGLDVTILLSLSTRIFETRTATGSELFSLLTCPRTTTFTSLNIFSPLEISSIKIWETRQTIRSWHAKCSLLVAVRVSNTLMLKLPDSCLLRTEELTNRNVLVRNSCIVYGPSNLNVGMFSALFPFISYVISFALKKRLWRKQFFCTFRYQHSQNINKKLE